VQPEHKHNIEDRKIAKKIPPDDSTPKRKNCRPGQVYYAPSDALYKSLAFGRLEQSIASLFIFSSGFVGGWPGATSRNDFVRYGENASVPKARAQIMPVDCPTQAKSGLEWATLAVAELANGAGE